MQTRSGRKLAVPVREEKKRKPAPPAAPPAPVQEKKKQKQPPPPKKSSRKQSISSERRTTRSQSRSKSDEAKNKKNLVPVRKKPVSDKKKSSISEKEDEEDEEEEEEWKFRYPTIYDVINKPYMYKAYSTEAGQYCVCNEVKREDHGRLRRWMKLQTENKTFVRDGEQLVPVREQNKIYCGNNDAVAMAIRFTECHNHHFPTNKFAHPFGAIKRMGSSGECFHNGVKKEHDGRIFQREFARRGMKGWFGKGVEANDVPRRVPTVQRRAIKKDVRDVAHTSRELDQLGPVDSWPPEMKAEFEEDKQEMLDLLQETDPELTEWDRQTNALAILQKWKTLITSKSIRAYRSLQRQQQQQQEQNDEE